MIDLLGMGRSGKPGTGEQLVLHDDVFLEQVLPAGMNRRLRYSFPARGPARRDRRRARALARR